MSGGGRAALRKRRSTTAGDHLTVTGLFAGIGGIEHGLHLAGHRSVLMCEIDAAASAVLRSRFPDASLERDVRELKRLPNADVLVAGFPCQDLSQAGGTAGIHGSRSGLVGEVFRLMARSRPRWLVLENVPFMLALHRGRAMRFLTSSIEELGYRWAYRVVDSRAFGLPQRRQRVIFLASRKEDPRGILFEEEAGAPSDVGFQPGIPYGFYWTEGTGGLGWAQDAVPTLKGGSTVGIPSPPAIWMPDGRIVTPDIRDAERLQGFPADWTAPAVADSDRRNGPRWKLVGNAVSVPVATWLGSRLRVGGRWDPSPSTPISDGERWPIAAWGEKGRRYRVERSMWPRREKTEGLAKFLSFPVRPLSARATAGFYARATKGRLRFQDGFLDAVAKHLDSMRFAEPSAQSKMSIRRAAG